ncbi:MAG: excisionase family DNA-binding protein [Hyphomicrobium sp.]|nr:excisionase family DNA-binding protein [Hyphomicrobium sp.]
MPRTDTDPTIPSDQEALMAREATRVLTGHPADGESLRLQVSAAGKEVTTLDLPHAAAGPLLAILKAMGEGRPVAVHAADAEVTTQQAADLLNVSRPFLVGMIDKGTLPARMVGNQRRLPLKDVLAYKRDTQAKRRAALDELAKSDQELGLR